MSRRSTSVRRRVSFVVPRLESLETRALLAPVIYAESDASKLYTIDVATGSAHFLATTPKQLTDIAFDADGNLFGVDVSGVLYGVDPKSGATSAIGSAGVMLNALAFAPDGTMYGAGYTGLYAIDPLTGSGRLIRDLSQSPSAGDLTFDASGNLILSTTNAGGLLIRVDTSTGEATTIGSLGTNDIFGLSYGSDGTIYAASYDGRQILTVNSDTGKTAQVSLLNGDSITKIYGTAFLDEARRPGISVADASAIAPLSGQGSLDFTVTLAYASDRPVSVTFATADETATSPGDYGATSGTATFAPGETSKTLSVPIVGKLGYSPAATFQMTLRDAKNGLLATTKATGTIQVPGAVPTVSLSVVENSFVENGGVTTVTATLSAASGVPTTVTLGFSGTAVLGKNFLATASSLVIPAGKTSASLTLQGQDDNAITGPLVANVSIAGLKNATPAGPQSVSVTETDTTVLPTVSVNTVTETDAGSSIAFLVSLSKPLLSPVSVQYATTGGTAVPGVDYDAVSGSVSFQVGETQALVRVPILHNPAYKRDKTFSLSLISAANAALAPGASGLGTIVNTVRPPTISIDDASKLEGRKGSSPIPVTIRLSSPSELPVSIVVDTRDGSARAKKDYLSLHATVTFQPGETVKLVTVSVLGNTKKQSDRSLFLDLSAISGPAVARGPATITILDDDGRSRIGKRSIGGKTSPVAISKTAHTRARRPK